MEFGAWDGIHLSNTFNLVENFGWSAVYVEADAEKFLDLLRTQEKYPSILAVCAMISSNEGEGFRTLDSILKEHNVSEVDLLSIDIDSNDLEIWASSQCDARVVVIEINSSIEPGLLRWHSPPKLTGNSFSSTLEVGRAKGYSLVCHTGNMIFVRNDLLPLIGMDSMDLQFPARLFLTDWIGLKPTLKDRFLKALTRFPSRWKTRIRSALGLKRIEY